MATIPISGIREFLIEPELFKFVQNSNAKVFKRFNLEKGQDLKQKYSEREKVSNERVSMTQIIMESWTGSRIYQLMTSNIKSTSFRNMHASSNFDN